MSKYKEGDIVYTKPYRVSEWNGIGPSIYRSLQEDRFGQNGVDKSRRGIICGEDADSNEGYRTYKIKWEDFLWETRIPEFCIGTL